MSEQTKATRRVKRAWQTSRNISKKKNSDGLITKNISQGLSLKTWAKKQVLENTSDSEDCKSWLKIKKAKQIRKPKQVYLKKTKA